MPITIGGAALRENDEGLVSLTDLYQAAAAQGMADGKRDPRRWKDEAGKDFIDVVAGTLNVRSADIMKSTRGKGGSTFANLNTGKSRIYKSARGVNDGTFAHLIPAKRAFTKRIAAAAGRSGLQPSRLASSSALR